MMHNYNSDGPAVWSTEYYPEEISEAMGGLANYDNGALALEDLKEICYWIKAAAENPYNSDAWRTFYTALEDITRHQEYEKEVNK